MAVASPSRLDPSEIPELVAKLRAVFDTGVTRPLAWRRQQLEAMRTMLEEREDLFLAALEADLGKPAIEAWAADIGFVINDVEHALKHLDSWTKPKKVRTPLTSLPGKSSIHHEPLGVVLIIGPWNYPVQLVLAPLVGAIAAGNAIVVKPSEVAAATSRALAETVPSYLDSDAIVIVEGAVPETTALLAERWDHIFYTGNGNIGRVVLEAAAKHLTPVTLELGGKSPAIVDRDANLDVTAHRIAWGKFMNAGQTCIAPDYLLVHSAVEGQLLDKMEQAIRDYYGADPRQSADYGRVINERHFDRLTSMLDEEPADRVVIGGETDRESCYIAPTIVRDVDVASKLMQDEIFGPILPVLSVPDAGAAIDFVNARDKPLALYVFSENDELVEKVVDHTSSGGVCVNATMYQITNPDLPFGGVGPSGMGAYHGRASFETFSHEKSVLKKSTRLDPPVAYPPYTKLKQRIIRRFL